MASIARGERLTQAGNLVRINHFNLAAHLGGAIASIYASTHPPLSGILLTILGLNLTGFVWTVDQDTHNTVTVEFYDREFHRDFHFTDPYMYDKACLSMCLDCLIYKSLLIKYR